MSALLGSLLLITSFAHAQTNNCADPNAEVSACPENYLPKITVPISGEKQDVINAIADANDAKAAEENALKELERLKLASKGDLTDGNYVKQLQIVQAATKAKYNLYNEAIRTAIVVYNLTPPVSDFTGDSRAAVGTTAKPWLPRYSEREAYENGHFRTRTVPELNAELARNGGVAGAKTWGQGEISLFSQAFKDPDALALAIYHETSHWVDIAGKTGGFKQSDLPIVSFESERDAYSREAKVAQLVGADPSHALALAARFEAQAKEVGTHDWGWVVVKHPNWIGADRRGRLAIVPPGPEAASDDEATLSKKMTELQEQVRENKEYMKQLAEEAQQARRDADARQAREEQELAEEQERQAREWAANLTHVGMVCDYKVAYQDNTGKFLGFQGDNEYLFFKEPYKTDVTINDIRIALLIARSCHELQYNSTGPSPHACNSAAPLIKEASTASDFPAKLDYLFGPNRSGCVANVFNNAASITDSASFDKVIAKYKKKLKDEQADYDRRFPSHSKETPLPARGGGGSNQPSDDKDYIYDPGCNCMIRRY